MHFWPGTNPNYLPLKAVKFDLKKLFACLCVLLFLLLFSIFWFLQSARKASLLFSLMLSFIFVAIYVLWSRQSLLVSCSTRLLAVSLLVSGLAYGAVFTPFSAPDEDYHYSASYVLSNFMLGQGYQSEDPVPMREDDANFFKGRNINLSSSGYDSLKEAFSEPFCQSNQITYVQTNRSHSISGNPPQCKIASALGITIARLLGLSSYLTYYFGRFFNLALYVFIIALAFRITPIGRSIFAVVSLLPMSLHLAVSYSYDAFVIPMSMLLIALCLRAIKGKGPIERNEWLSIGVVGAVLAPCKVIYVLLVFMCVFIPKERFDSRANEVAIKGGCILVSLMPVLIMRMGSILMTAGVASSNQPTLSSRGGNQNDLGTYYTVSDVLHDPLKFLFMIVRTLDQFGFQYLQRMVGGTLGWFQAEIVAPDLMVVALTMVLALSVFTSADDNLTISSACRISAALLFLLGSLSVLAALLFSWTFTTDNVIYGVQGRYFIPFLPWLLLSLRSRRMNISANMIPVLICAISFLNVLNLIRIFSVALTL